MSLTAIAAAMRKTHAQLVDETRRIEDSYYTLTGNQLDPSSTRHIEEAMDDAVLGLDTPSPVRAPAKRLSSRDKLRIAVTSENRADGWGYEDVVAFWVAKQDPVVSKSSLRTAAKSLRDDKVIRSDYGRMYAFSAAPAQVTIEELTALTDEREDQADDANT